MICGDKIIRDGTNQLERFQESLGENYVLIDERTKEELLQFLQGIAGELAFYNLDFEPQGTWQSVVEELSAPTANLPLTSSPQQASHISLLHVLSHLFTFAQKELNAITGKHLDFYYRDILGIQPKAPIPDQVHLIFELAKSRQLQSVLLKADTSLMGKTEDGVPLEYKTDRELVASKAKVAQVKSWFVESTSAGSRIFAAPIANSIDGLGEPLSEEIPFWAPFGEVQLDKPPEERTMIDANLGFAVSSPILHLQEGHRLIDVCFHFLPIESFAPTSFLQESFKIYYSTSDQWVEPFYYTSELVFGLSDPPLPDEVEHWQLRFHIELEEGQAAFTFFNAEFFEEKFSTEWPLLKVLIRPDSLGYDTLWPLELDRVDIEVEARGVKDLQIQNEVGVLDPSKPFLPFGPQPVLNSSFYIGSGEVFRKKLHYLQLQIQWHNIPDSQLAFWYNEYGIGPTFGNNSFEARIQLLLNRSWNQNLQVSQNLFNATDANAPLTIKIPESQYNFAANYEAAPKKEPLLPYNVTTERGFIRFNLRAPNQPFKAFGHQEFTNIYTRQAIALARFDPSTGDPEPQLPNPPYTPTIRALSLDYKSRQSFATDAQNEQQQLFQITPFGFRGGYTNIQARLIAVMEEEGALLLGLEEVVVPQTLNLLFQVEEGTARQDVVLNTNDIHWSFLSNNRWVQLSQNEVLADGTQGFKRSGIISLVLPKAATNSNQALPTGFFWLKAGAKGGAQGAAKLHAIFNNAVRATLVMKGENLDGHLQQGLAPDSVNKLVNRIVGIKKIRQPLPSRGGQPKELNTSYYTRVSERLRHKKRGIQVWDFERLVLEAFPNVFKVKCLSHTDTISTHAAGAITLIVVSNLRNQEASSPFQPRTSRTVLEQIQAYVQKFVSPFVKIHVEQPIYESILVDAKVGFHMGFDPGFYSNQLNTELKQFLSPWAFNNGEDIVIGGTIFKSAILKFMESREYVDYIVDFKLYHKHGGPIGPGIGEMGIGEDFEIASTITPGIGGMEIGLDLIVGADVPFACATTVRTILVSADDHRIAPLRPEEYICVGASSLGIGFMTVNIDWLVGEGNI